MLKPRIEGAHWYQDLASKPHCIGNHQSDPADARFGIYAQLVVASSYQFRVVSSMLHASLNRRNTSRAAPSECQSAVTRSFAWCRSRWLKVHRPCWIKRACGCCRCQAQGAQALSGEARLCSMDHEGFWPDIPGSTDAGGWVRSLCTKGGLKEELESDP